MSLHNATSITSWSWDFGDGQSSSAQNPCHLYTTFGIYNVILTVTNDLGCVDDTMITVEVYPLPIPDFSDSSLCDFTVYFTDLTIANAASITSWAWDFDDGGTSSLQNPSHTYATFNSYNVTLIVTNSNGCVDSITRPVVVQPTPIADFTSDTVCALTPTQFTDLSVSNFGVINGWSWDFGDGGTSSIQSPTHIYTAPGTYAVTLIIQTSVGCYDTAYGFAEVWPLPVASFSATPVCDGDSMCFTDLSIANSDSIVSWSWNFGDGGTSIDQNPCHLYPTNGTYNVTLTVINSIGCSDDTTITVEVLPFPIADFSYSVACDYTTTFTDLSIANAGILVSWSWDFGDGNTSILQNPVHAYASSGTYNVTLTVYNSIGCDGTIILPVVVFPSPVADFTWDTACALLPTHFTDLSSSNYGIINSWNWDFGDGNNSIAQNPVHTYTSPGTYTVTLVIETVDGCQDTATGQVLVWPNPIASFSTIPVCDGDSMCFTDLSVANAASITSWLWNFGDGGTSTEQDPCHLYATNGIYNVTLTVTNSYGCVDDTTIAVEVYPNPVADFSYVTDCEFEAIFTDLSIPNAASITSWQWNFGDGGSSTTQNPTYTYATFGTYNVQLIVTNSNGCIDSITLTVVIPEMPVADFTADTACEGTPTQFTDLSISNSSPITTWAWAFGDGGTSAVQNPVYTYTTAGTFAVTLTVTNAAGCIDDTTINVVVLPAPEAIFTAAPVCEGDSTCFTQKRCSQRMESVARKDRRQRRRGGDSGQVLYRPLARAFGTAQD
jgi:PKD repeat protein